MPALCLKKITVEKTEVVNPPNKNRPSGASIRQKKTQESLLSRKKLADQEEELRILQTQVSDLSAVLRHMTNQVVKGEDHANFLLELASNATMRAVAAEQASNCGTLAQALESLKEYAAAEQRAATQRNTVNEQKIAALDQLVSELQIELAVSRSSSKPPVAPELEAVHSALPVQASVTRGSVFHVQAPPRKASPPSPSAQTGKPSQLQPARPQVLPSSTPVSVRRAFPTLSSSSSACFPSCATTPVAVTSSSSKHPARA